MTAPTFTGSELRDFDGKLNHLKKFMDHPRAQHPQVKDKIEFMIHAYEQAILFGDSDDMDIQHNLIQLVQSAVKMEADVIEYVVVQAGPRVVIEEQRFQWL